MTEKIYQTNDLLMKETNYLTGLVKQNEYISLKVRTDSILKMYPRLEQMKEKILDDLAQLKVILHSMMAKKAKVDYMI